MLYASLYIIIIASFTIITYYAFDKINANQLKSDNSNKLVNVYNDIQTCKLFYTNNSTNIKHKIVKLLTNDQCTEYLNSFLNNPGDTKINK